MEEINRPAAASCPARGWDFRACDVVMLEAAGGVGDRGENEGEVAAIELEAESRLVIDDRRPGTELDSGECARRPRVRAGHEAQHRPVRVGDVHCNPEVSAVMDGAMFNTEFGASIDHGGHFLSRPEHEGTDIEAVQDRTARTIFALAQPDHEPRCVIGKDDTSDCGVLEELVGQFQIEEVCVPPGADRQVTHRQLDLADAHDGELHKLQSGKGVAARVVSLTPKVGGSSKIGGQERSSGAGTAGRRSLPFAASAWRGGPSALGVAQAMICPCRAGLPAEYRLTGG